MKTQLGSEFCWVTTLPWRKVVLKSTLFYSTFAPHHHEHIIKHPLLSRVANEGELIPIDQASAGGDPQAEAGVFFSGYPEEVETAPTFQGKPRCI